MGVTRILQFSQRNGKLSLQQIKQGNYPVIPIYACIAPCLLHTCTLTDYMPRLIFPVVDSLQDIGVILSFSGVSSVACLGFWFPFLFFVKTPCELYQGC